MSWAPGVGSCYNKGPAILGKFGTVLACWVLELCCFHGWPTALGDRTNRPWARRYRMAVPLTRSGK